MNKKRVVALLLVAIMTIVMIAGCTDKKAAKDILQESLIKSQQMKSSEFQVEAAIQLTPSQDLNSDLAFTFGMLNNIKLSFQGKMDIEAQRAIMEGNLDLGGMAFNIKLYTFDEKIALEFPMLYPGYILIDPATMTGGQDIALAVDQEQAKKISEKVIKSSLKALDSNVIKDNGTKNIDVNNQSLKATELEMTIGQKELMALAKAMIEMFKEDSFREMVANLVMSSDPFTSKEEVYSLLDQMSAASDDMLREGLQEISNVMEIKDDMIKSKMYIDNNSNLVKSITDISTRVKEGTGHLDINFNITTETWNINKAGKVEIPEINDKNSIGIEELLYGSFFNPFF